MHTYRRRIGNVVGFTGREGQMYERMYVKHINASKSTAATLQRSKFRFLVDFAYKVGLIIGNLYQYRAKERKISVRNLFYRYGMPALTGSSPDNLGINYSTLFSNPSGLGNVGFSAARFDETLTVTVNFAAQIQVGDEDDTVCIGLYAPEVEESLIDTSATRTDGRVEISVPAGWNGLTVHVWGWTKANKNYYCEATAASIKKDMCSDVTYIGNGTIL